MNQFRCSFPYEEGCITTEKPVPSETERRKAPHERRKIKRLLSLELYGFLKGNSQREIYGYQVFRDKNKYLFIDFNAYPEGYLRGRGTGSEELIEFEHAAQSGCNHLLWAITWSQAFLNPPSRFGPCQLRNQIKSAKKCSHAAVTSCIVQCGCVCLSLVLLGAPPGERGGFCSVWDRLILIRC